MAAECPADVRKEQDLERLEKTAFLKGNSAKLYGAASHRQTDTAVSEEDEVSLLPSSAIFKGRAPYLDITRVVCVWLVCVDHGNSSFGVWNVVFCQHWVLQYLFMICGIAYGVSSKPLGSFLGRLASYFVIGAGTNLFAWVVTGQDWSDQLFNVVFQFWFVVGIMLYACVLAPLKPFLARLRDEAKAERSSIADYPSHEPQSEQPEAPEAEHPLPEETSRPLASFQSHDAMAAQLFKLLVLFILGPLMISFVFSFLLVPMVDLSAPAFIRFTSGFGGGAAYWGMPQNTEEARQFLQNLCTYFQLTISSIFIVLAYPRLFKDVTLIGWLVLANTYGHRLAFYRGREERFFHGLDLMMIALVCYYLGLKRRRTVGRLMARYWFVLLFICSLGWPPGTYGRYDENPPREWYNRVSFNINEAIFVIWWLTAGDRIFDYKIFKDDRMEFIGDWSLILFLVHKAVHIMVLPPFNWIVLLAIAPVCWRHHRLKRLDDAPQQQAAPYASSTISAPLPKNTEVPSEPTAETPDAPAAAAEAHLPPARSPRRGATPPRSPRQRA